MQRHSLYGENEERQKSVLRILLQLRIMLANYCPDIGHSWDAEFYSERWNGDWDKTAERELRSKGKGKNSFHYNDSEETTELILSTIISVNQLSIYGAVADLCKELTDDSEVSGNSAPNQDSESMEIPTELPIADPHTNAESEGNFMQDYEHKIEQLPEDQKVSKLCCDVGLKIVERGQFFITHDRKYEDRPGLGCEGLLS